MSSKSRSLQQTTIPLQAPAKASFGDSTGTLWPLLWCLQRPSRWEVRAIAMAAVAVAMVAVVMITMMMAVGCFSAGVVWAGTKAPHPLRIALLVGHNQGTSDLKPLRYAQHDAQRVARVLQELGGFKKSQMYLLLGPSRARLRQTLKHIEKRLQRANGKGTFLFYYSGHARLTHFLLGAESVSFREIVRFVGRLRVGVRLMLIDSCYSGTLIRTKGQQVQSKGARRRAFVRWLPHSFRTRTQGLAILTSSGEGERSYESTRIRSSFFTSSLISGLRGAADRNKDQRVTLGELRQYVYVRTIAHSALHHVKLQRPAHQINLRGQGPLILTYLKRAESHLWLASDVQGHCFVYHKGDLVHEFEKHRGQDMTIGLRAGEYQLQVRWKGWMGIRQATLRQRQQERISSAQLAWEQLSIGEQVKGGNAAFSTGLGFLVHYLPIGNVSLHGVGLSLSLDVRRWLSLSLRYQYAPTNFLALPHQTHDLALRLNLGYGLGFAQFWGWAGAFVEPRMTWRTFDKEVFINTGLAAGATVHFDYCFSPRWALRLLLAGGFHVVLFDQDVRVAPFFDVGMGFVLRL